MTTSNIKMFSILFILSMMSSLAQTEDLFIGQLEPYQHRVSGKVWIVSETQLRLTEFNYDGQGPGTFMTNMVHGNIVGRVELRRIRCIRFPVCSLPECNKFDMRFRSQDIFVCTNFSAKDLSIFQIVSRCCFHTFL